MLDIYATDMEFEQCRGDKERIRIAVPYGVIHYVLSGQGYINGEKIGAGTAFSASGDSDMDYYPDREDPWSYIYVRVYGADVKKAWEESGLQPGIRVLSFTQSKQLWELLDLYHTMGGSEDPKVQQVIANALFLLWGGEQKAGGTSRVQEQNALRVRNYLDRNFYKKITMQSVAQSLYLSRDYMRNLFMRFYGISPKQYLQKIRMQRAQHLLKETDITVKVVALSVGYEDPLLFSRMFSKFAGLSPERYRESVRKER